MKLSLFKDTEKNNKLKTSFIILIILNLLLFLIISALFLLNTDNNRKFNRNIFLADAFILKGNFSGAEEILKKSEAYAKTKNKVHILLKRISKISDVSGDYIYMEHLGDFFYRKYRKDMHIKKTYLFSLLKNNKMDLFFDIFPGKINNDPFLEDLFLEGYSAYLNGQPGNIKKISALLESLNNNIYMRLLSDRNNHENYLSAYEKDRNTEFLNNLILLYMIEGITDKAVHYIPLTDNNDLLSSLVYLDTGNFSKSLLILSGMTENSSRIKMLKADAEMFLERFDLSFISYQSIYNDDPGFSNIPLLNLIWLEYRESGIINEKYLSAAFRNNPQENIKNLVFFINLHNNIQPESVDVMDYNIPLLNDLFSCSPENINKYTNILWSFLNNYSTEEDFNRYFAYYLLETGKYREIDILLQKEVFRNSKDYCFFNSFSNLHYGNISEAENSLKDCLKDSKSPEIFYNLALIDIKKGDFSGAEKYLDIITNNEIISDRNLLSDSYFWKAYVLYRTHDYNESLVMLNKSLSLDRANIEAEFLLNHIKSKIVES